MQIVLTPELEKLVNDQVATGRFCSASEVIGEALLLLRERERVRQLCVEELRREIAIGTEEADRGDVAPLDIEDIKRRVREHA